MSTLQEWVDKYPGDPEALVDALVLETERLSALWIAETRENERLLDALIKAHNMMADGEPYGHIVSVIVSAIQGHNRKHTPPVDGTAA